MMRIFRNRKTRRKMAKRGLLVLSGVATLTVAIAAAISGPPGGEIQCFLLGGTGTAGGIALVWAFAQL